MGRRPGAGRGGLRDDRAFPPSQALYERDLATVRAQLDAEAFEAFWEVGRSMNVKEAGLEALADYT